MPGTAPVSTIILTTSLPSSTTVIGAATPAPPYAASTYYVTITSSSTDGSSTAWTTAAPSWSVSGIAGSSVTSAGVNSNTSANIYLKIGALAGTTRTALTLTDATSGGSVQILVTPGSTLAGDTWLGVAAHTAVGTKVATFPTSNTPTWTHNVVGGFGSTDKEYCLVTDGAGNVQPYYQSDNYWYSLNPPAGQPPISNNTNSYISSGYYNIQGVSQGSFTNPSMGFGICLDGANGNGYFLNYTNGTGVVSVQKISGGVASSLFASTLLGLVNYNQGTLTPVQFGCLNNGDGSATLWYMIGSQFGTLNDYGPLPTGGFGLLGYENSNTSGQYGQSLGCSAFSVNVANIAASGHLVKTPATPFCALGDSSAAFNLISTPPGSLFGSGVTDAITLTDGTAGGAFKNLDGSSLTPIVLSDANPTAQFKYQPARLTGTNIVASGVASNSAPMTPSAPVMYCAYDPIKPVGNNAPMISAPSLTGMTPYATTQKSGKEASQTYSAWWYSNQGATNAAPQVLGFDLSTLSAGQKTRVLVRLESAQSSGAHDVSGLYNAVPDAACSAYTLEINKVDAAGTPPSDTSSNWIACPTFATPTDYFVPDPNAITGNNYRTLVHACDMTGANWFRIKVTATYGQQVDANNVGLAALHCEFYDVRNFNTISDYERGFAGNLFLTDSVGDNSWMFVPGNAYGNNFVAKGYNALIGTMTFPGSHTYDFEPGGPGYAIFQRAMKRFPGKFVNIAEATNDLSTNPGNVNCIRGLDGLAQMCLMAGKVPVVCTPPYASNGTPSPAGQALDANLDDTTQLPAAGYTGPHIGDQILTVYPAARPWWIAGPDETTYFKNNPSQMNASDIHPAGAGVQAWLSNWAASNSASMYSAQAGAQTPTVTSVVVSPSAPNVAGNATQQFSAVVSGTNSPAQTVTWTLQSGVGSINASGLYTAPSSTGSAQSAVVQATSTVDNTKYGTATVTIPAVVITISGPTSGADGSVVALTATGGTAPYAWGTDLGTIDSTGHLTLPATGTGTAHITASGATGAFGTYTVAYAPAGSTVTSVSVAPNSANVAGRATQQFSATVAGTNSPSQAVTWSLASGVGSINSSGLYTAPNSTGSAQSATIKATSAQDSTKSTNATIAIPAITVAISGATQGVDGAVIPLSATGGTSYTWAAAGGAIDQSGNLTLPSSGAGTIQVTATDVTGAFGTYNVSYAPPASNVSSVAVSPATATIAGAGTQQFTAVVNGSSSPSQSVTWSIASGVGTINASGVYTAPAAIGSAQSATVQATSVQDNTKSGTATITISAASTGGSGGSGSGLTTSQAAQLSNIAAFISTLQQTQGGLLKVEVDAYAAGEDPVTLMKADSDIRALIADSNGAYVFSPPTAYPGYGTLTLRDKAGANVVAIITLSYDANQNLIQRSVA